MPTYIATERTDGLTLYFTGFVSSPFADQAKVFPTRALAEAEVAPWNALGHRFSVRLVGSVQESVR